uniref:Nebulin n=1 Tax=Latimeria chalumnae TaxID=7897 RepID=H3AZM9_LATCH
MGILFTKLWRLFNHQEHKVIIVGLDNAGKTTILYQFSMDEVVHTSPTIGSNVEEIVVNNTHFLMWDIGGQESLRSSWNTYYTNTEFVIVVVDSTDRERISLTREELYKMLANEDLKKAGLLVFANKQDVKGCMTVPEISQYLKLTSIKDHQWHIQACCALTGEGLSQGLEWMMSRLRLSLHRPSVATDWHSGEKTFESGLPIRKVVKKSEVDTSKFMTPYLAHSQKMQELFSQNKYKEQFQREKGKPYVITPDIPEIHRIKKAQQQLSEVKYRMEGDKAKTICHYDGTARDVEHAKKVSQLVSKVLYKQNWEDTKDKYLLPPDAPELVQAVKNAANISKKLYTEAWDEDKTTYYPYSDSPELRRVAAAQKALSDIQYKKGHDERKAKYTALAEPPEVELAKKVFAQRSDLKYHEDYKKNVKGKWSQVPCYDVAVARMNADNLSTKLYQADYEAMKDQIYFMQTETPQYAVAKRARLNASEVKYKENFEKTKNVADYNILPATENPLLRQMRAAGRAMSDKLYKKDYEKAKGKSIDYCITPKFQIDKMLQDYSDIKYKDAYEKKIKGHYIGSYEDPYMLHCMKVEGMKNIQNYRADYEYDKTKSYFPQTITPEYEAIKKSYQCKDYLYKKHPDKIPFTQVTDSPVLVQAKINAQQLSDLNYKMKHEKEKFKCSIPANTPFFLQSRENAYNLSDKWYKYDWEKAKDKKFEIKVDAIPILAAKAHRNIASDVRYKKDYEKSKGKMVGALSIQDDPKILHSVHVAKIQSDREYKKAYEKTKTKYNTPLDMILVTLAKKSQAIASNLDYKQPFHRYFYPPDSIAVNLAKKAYTLQSDNDYKADYNNWYKGTGWLPLGSLDVEKAKKAGQILNEKKYRQHPDTIKFTAVEDSPVMVQAKINQGQRSDLNYKAEGEKIIHKYSLPPDVPNILQARVNAYNLSQKQYKADWEKALLKGYDLKADAIPIVAAKAARKAASDVQYKKAYEQNRGKHIGFRSLQDDPKLVHYMHVAKIQSNQEYKKDYEKIKTKYNTPLDMFNITGAKKSQEIASNVNYKQLIHHYTYLPDAMNLELSRNRMRIQSDNVYKADYNNWMKGIGWIPIGSLDVEKAKKAAAALSEKKYRQHPDTIKFTSVSDTPVMVQAKVNADQISDRLYKSGGEKIKHKYNLPPDVPQFIQAKCNAYNISDKYYKMDWQRTIAKGHNLKNDAISVVAAKASRNIASDYKYKEAYEKTKGKHVGFRSLQDDPKLVHYMHVAKMQSEREYKKDYEKAKTKYHTPLDMLSVIAAKKAQEVTSNINYKQLIHNYTYLPDAVNLELSRNMMQIQSDNLYKSDYNNWFKGIGWIPIGSFDVEKVKKAGEALNEKKYRQHPATFKFTSLTDSMNMVLAQTNTKQLSDLNYKASGEKVKHKYNLPADVPHFLQAKANAYNISDTYYKLDWKKTIAKGYDMKPDAIPIIAAKASRNIASDYKYKEAYEKQRGKHVGFRSLQDDPKLVHFMHVAKMQSDREYRKAYEKTKTKYHTPPEMFSIMAAKQAHAVISNTNYKQLIHNYTLLPDAMNLQLTRNMMQIQSDNAYKMDYNSWFKGIGWVPIESLDVTKAKKAGEILREKTYRQHPSTLKFTHLTDSMDMVLAKTNAQTINKKLYTDAWEKEKSKIHIMPDTPEIFLSKTNQINMSKKLYTLGWEEAKKKGYDMRPDAIPIKAAKAARDIASDHKYKQAYEATRGKHIGFRSLQDDPKLVHFMQVAKMQSDREYKKNYEKIKTNFHTPVDMFSIMAAKKGQEVATNTNYKQMINRYTLVPDAMNLELTKNMMQIQSDNLYKSEFTGYLRGVGWVPIGSLEVEKNKKAAEILSEKKYRQHPSLFKFTSTADDMNIVLAQTNAKQISNRLYKEAWEKDKSQIHVMPDTPEIVLAKTNSLNISDKNYRLALEESKKKGHNLRQDAISILAAKASRDIASDYKYKFAYEKEKGKHIGFRSLQDDPKLVHFMHVAKMQSDREYKKAYEKTKTKYHTPLNMFSVMAAKQAQAAATNTNYKQLIHNYTLLPDAVNIELTRNMSNIQSNNAYKMEYNSWFKGIGWVPIGSLDVEKAKKAGEILNEKKYRQHPNTVKFTSVTDSMDMVLAKTNALTLNKRLYTEAWEKEKGQVHVMPDTPEILQAKQNKITFSEKMYKLGWEEAKKKGHDLRADAIAIKAAKASRDIASEYKYKEAYRKQQGHHIGCRSLQDDPKMVWSMHIAKIQSDREYKKDFEKWKTKFNMPVDMLGFLLAKKCQTLVSDIDYRRYLHQWTCLPDQTDVIHAKKVYEQQSDNAYKSDIQWLKGIGWSPLGSLEVEKSKKAAEILSEKKYRQLPQTFKFTSTSDAMDLVLARNNAKQMSDRLYKEAWEKDKTQIHIMPDTPQIVLAKANLINTSDKLYKMGYEELKKKGHDLRADAISIKAAKASRDIASEVRLFHFMLETKKEKISKTSIQNTKKISFLMFSSNISICASPPTHTHKHQKKRCFLRLDMRIILLIISNLLSPGLYNSIINVGNNLCLKMERVPVPQHTMHTYGFEMLFIKKKPKSQNMRIGLISFKVQLSYFIITYSNQQMHFTTNQSTLTPNPVFHLVLKCRTYVSPILLGVPIHTNLHSTKKFTISTIEIISNDLNSVMCTHYKYKEAYRKQQGHHIGCRNLQDDPKMVWSMHIAKIQSDREYKKNFEKWKTKFNMPVDMLGFLLAKKCQTLVSDIDYRRYLHQWTCLPDQNDVIQAKKAYELQSDNMYKSDLQWLKGIGWSPVGSLDVEKSKKATEILSEKKYRQHPHTFKFTSTLDAMPLVLAKTSALNVSNRLYTDAWEKDKTKVHIMPDTPEIMLAKQNKINFSEVCIKLYYSKQYKLGMEESKKKGIDFRADAISIKAAKASRDIASDKNVVYKAQNYHQGEPRILDGNPIRLMLLRNNSLKEDCIIKTIFIKFKLKRHFSWDLIVLSFFKNCLINISLGTFSCLQVFKSVFKLNNAYKSDLQWLKGIGWVPIGSLDVEKVKKAGEILSESKYRQRPDQFKFTSVTDSMEIVLAKANAITLNKRLYTEAWDKDKTTIHIMPDTPEITLARQNKTNYSLKQYRLGLEESKKKGYDMRADAIPIKAAKSSRDIASDFLYKHLYKILLTHHIGCRSLQDDPKMVWSMHVAKVQSDREYKKDFEKWRTKFNMPVDMLGFLLAKKCQTLVSDIDYRKYLHQWTCLPDQNDVIQAKKAYELQSDNAYKSDLQWLKGIGWVPIGSLDVEKVKKAGEILSEKKYRQHPDKFKFTSVTDSVDLVLAKTSAQNINKVRCILY